MYFKVDYDFVKERVKPSLNIIHSEKIEEFLSGLAKHNRISNTGVFSIIGKDFVAFITIFSDYKRQFTKVYEQKGNERIFDEALKMIYFNSKRKGRKKFLNHININETFREFHRKF